MKLIDENYEGLDLTKESSLLQHYFEYTVNPADFQLKLKNIWDVTENEVDWFRLKIGHNETILPSNIYIMLADVHSSSVDWVRVDEINNRPMTTALYFADLKADKYSIEPIEVLGIAEDMNHCSIIPNTKNLLPVLVGDDRMVLCSDRDSFVKTKNMNFTCLY